MKIVVAASLVLLLGHDTDVFAFQVSPGTTPTTPAKHQSRLPRLDYTMDAYDAMYKMYTTEPKDVVPVRPAVSEQQQPQSHQTVSPTPSSIQTGMFEASPSEYSLEGYQQSQGGAVHAVMSTSLRAASVEQTKQLLAVQATLKAQQEQIAATMQTTMRTHNKRLSASVQAAARSLADVLDSMSKIEKGVPPSIIQGAALATFSLSLITTRDLTLSGLAGATSAYLSITPGLVGNAVRSVGEKFTAGLSEAGILLNQAVATVRATEWDIEKIKDAGSSFLVKYIKNIHQQAARFMPFLFRPPKDEQELFGAKENRVTELFFANETHAFDSDFFFAAQVEANGVAPAQLSVTQHESEMTQDILLRLIEEYVQEAEDILAGLKVEEEATAFEHSSVAHGEIKRETMTSTPLDMKTAMMQKETEPRTPVQSVDVVCTDTTSTATQKESRPSASLQTVEARSQSTTAVTEAPEFGASAQPVRSNSMPAQGVSNYSWKSASENLSSPLPQVENTVTTRAHAESVSHGQVNNDAHVSSTAPPYTWFPASDVRSSNDYIDDLEGNLRQERQIDDTVPAGSSQGGQIAKSSSSWSTGGYLDNL